jgi:hypothetical protein
MAIRTSLATRSGSAALTTAIVGLALASGYIHLTLGGLLFTLNGLGYAALAAAMVVGAVGPHPVVDRFSWLPRVGLLGYTFTTIVGYLIIGPYFALGWLTKAVEVALIGLLVADMARVYGSVGGLVGAARASLPGRPPHVLG